MDTIVYTIDHRTWLPRLLELKKLYHQVVNKEKHNGIGPGGVWDDLLSWVIEVNKAWETDCTNFRPSDHPVPNIHGYGKRVLRYEELFLKMATTLWRVVLPKGIISAFYVAEQRDRALVVVTYDITQWVEQNLVDPSYWLVPEVFLRSKSRSKKVQQRHQLMKSKLGHPK